MADFTIKGMISIHAPLAGSDAISFNSSSFPSRISIHAPLAGSDIPHQSRVPAVPDFNPRSPCGERRQAVLQHITDIVISIHAPLAGSDVGTLTLKNFALISIHAPLAGSDFSDVYTIVTSIGISIHAPLAGSDLGAINSNNVFFDFNPRSPCGERRIAP